DAIALHRDVGGAARRSAPVDHRAAANQERPRHGSGLDDGHRLHPVALLDAVDVLHAAHHLAEDGVVAVEVWRRAVGDVELAPRGVGMLAARHRQRAAHVLPLAELGLDRVARAAGAVALGIAALDDEVRHDAVEGEVVVKTLLGQRDEVLDGLGCILRVELDADLVAVLQRDDRCLFHFWTTLMDLIRSPTLTLSTTSIPLVTRPKAVY